MSIVVYTKENCQPCRATKRRLEAYDLSFEEVNAIENVEALKELGFSEAPVVVYTGPNNEQLAWSGYRPDLIDQLKDVINV